MLKKLAHLVLFFAGMAFVDVNLHDVDLLPFWSWSRDKVNWVSEHGEDYDTLFLGSSRMHYGLKPEVFDARMAELGQATRSFNFAFSGARMHDVAYMLDWLARHKPQRLKRVVIELHSFDQRIRGGQWFSDQDLEMHAPAVFAMRMQSVAVGKTSLVEKAEQAQYVLLHSLSNALCLGQGVRITSDWIAKSHRERIPNAYDVADGGWQDVASLDLEHMRKEHANFSSQPEACERKLGWKVSRDRIEVLEGGFNPAAVRSIAERMRACGVEPIFVVMPTYASDFFGRDGVAGIASEVRILELDDPAPNRPIYELSYYYDVSHLNSEGAKAFSRFLAERVVEAEAKPIGTQLSPRMLPDSKPTLRASWKDGKRETVEARVEGLPFVGDLFVQVGEPGSMKLENEIEVSVAQPPKATITLQRELLYSARGELSAEGLPEGLPLVLQLGVIVDGKVVVTSDPVRIEPR